MAFGVHACRNTCEWKKASQGLLETVDIVLLGTAITVGQGNRWRGPISVEQEYLTLGVRTRSSNENCRRRGRCGMQQVRMRENDTPMQDRNKSRCREMQVE